MIKNPSDAAVRRIMKENDVVQSAIQLANSGYTINSQMYRSIGGQQAPVLQESVDR